MFHSIPAAMLDRMRYLEEIDARDRVDGTPHHQRLRQITPETGKFLALMAAAAPEGIFLEIGTSGGYSTLWLALACQHKGCRLTTFEWSEEKVRLAEDTFRLAGVDEMVDLVVGDARDRVADYGDIAFCFLDAEKDTYVDYYDLVVPKLVEGGLLIADNVTDQREALQRFVDNALSDARVDAVVVPVGNGELVCRRTY